MENLLVERVLRKSRRVLEVWEASGRDWNQTLYHMTAYAMGAPKNGSQMEELSGRATYLMCLKERSSLQRVEALLLGGSGLLNEEFFDDYIVRLQEEFDYLASKYQIRSMSAGCWKRNHQLPAGGPVMRIAQLAALVGREEFSVDRVLEIATLEAVERLFGVTASDYWQRRYVPNGKAGSGLGRMGRQKAQMLAINMVVPLQFAYASVIGKAELKERALGLLEAIPAEQNRVVAGWTGYGVPCTAAYESQALLELSARCDQGLCGECPLGRVRREK